MCDNTVMGRMEQEGWPDLSEHSVIDHKEFPFIFFLLLSKLYTFHATIAAQRRKRPIIEVELLSFVIAHFLHSHHGVPLQLFLYAFISFDEDLLFWVVFGVRR